MGADFSNRWFFAGDAETADTRRAVVERLRHGLHQAGYQEIASEVDAQRSLVVGPVGRWIMIGDSAGSTERSDPKGFAELSRTLSTLGAVIEVKMSDSAAVHFYLYRQGRIVDQFGNAKFPFFAFATDAQAAPYRGRPDLWADLLLLPGTVGALRSAWVQEWQAPEILEETGRLLGWDTEMLWVGYSHDDEGLATKYDEFLQDSPLELEAFDEYHFQLPANLG